MNGPNQSQDEQNESAKDSKRVVLVDVDRCIGSGMCEMLEESIFLIDEDTNIAGVLGDGSLAADRATAVIDRCPASAIAVI